MAGLLDLNPTKRKEAFQGLFDDPLELDLSQEKPRGFGQGATGARLDLKFSPEELKQMSERNAATSPQGQFQYNAAAPENVGIWDQLLANSKLGIKTDAYRKWEQEQGAYNFGMKAAYENYLKQNDPEQRMRDDIAKNWGSMSPEQRQVAAIRMGGIKELDINEKGGKGMFGDKSETERMLSTYHDVDAEPQARSIAHQYLTRPRVISTPEGTYTIPGFNLPPLGQAPGAPQGQQGQPIRQPQAGGSHGIPGFTPAKATEGERERAGLVEMAKEAAGIYDMDPSIVDMFAMDNLPAYVSPSFMSEQGQIFASHEANLRSIIGKIYSGAALNEVEIENIARGYLPQPNDTKTTREMKRRKFQALVQQYEKTGPLTEAPSGQRAIDRYGD